MGVMKRIVGARSSGSLLPGAVLIWLRETGVTLAAARKEPEPQPRPRPKAVQRMLFDRV